MLASKLWTSTFGKYISVVKLYHNCQNVYEIFYPILDIPLRLVFIFHFYLQDWLPYFIMICFSHYLGLCSGFITKVEPSPKDQSIRWEPQGLSTTSSSSSYLSRTHNIVSLGRQFTHLLNYQYSICTLIQPLDSPFCNPTINENTNCQDLSTKKESNSKDQFI